LVAESIAARRRAKPSPAAIAAAAAAIAVLVTQLLDFGAWDLRVHLLDSGYEWSYSHILATLAFAAGAVICGANAAAAPRMRGTWWIACALFGVLLLDNVTRLHEHVPMWPIVYGPFLAALCVSIIRVTAGSRQARLVHVGVALLCISLAIHVFGPPLVHLFGWGADSWAYQVKIAVKEGTELAGWVLLVPALARQT
jgi:hypothetical protein